MKENDEKTEKTEKKTEKKEKEKEKEREKEKNDIKLNDKLMNEPTTKPKKSNSRGSKLKNVDRNNAQVKAITVNNVTVIITEFPPKKRKNEPQ